MAHDWNKAANECLKFWHADAPDGKLQDWIADFLKQAYEKGRSDKLGFLEAARARITELERQLKASPPKARKPG